MKYCLSIFLGMISAIQISAQNQLPLLSFEVNKHQVEVHERVYSISKVSIKSKDSAGIILWSFSNISKDTISLSNVVPFGTHRNHVFITGLGNHPLSRTHLFLPERIPVNIIVPDNAWDLGFAAVMEKQEKIASLTRRIRESIVNGQRKRFETILYPGGSVSYMQWSLPFTGSWQEGRRRIFQEIKLFDLINFDRRLYERTELQWIRPRLVMPLSQGLVNQLIYPNAG